MDKRDILIRLLKDGHINEEEFKFLYEESVRVEYIPQIPIPYDPYPTNPWIQPYSPFYTTTGGTKLTSS